MEEAVEDGVLGEVVIEDGVLEEVAIEDGVLGEVVVEEQEEDGKAPSTASNKNRLANTLYQFLSA